MLKLMQGIFGVGGRLVFKDSCALLSPWRPEHAAPAGHWSHPQWGSQCDSHGWSQPIGPPGLCGHWWRGWCRNVGPLTASPLSVSHLATDFKTNKQIKISEKLKKNWHLLSNFSQGFLDQMGLPTVLIWTPSLQRVWVHWGTSGNAPWPAKRSTVQRGARTLVRIWKGNSFHHKQMQFVF